MLHFEGAVHSTHANSAQKGSARVARLCLGSRRSHYEIVLSKAPNPPGPRFLVTTRNEVR